MPNGVSIELDSGPVILDTGSPVSLGDGSTYRFDGIACQTKPSLLLYSWTACEKVLFQRICTIEPISLSNLPLG